jgi:GT2 family glycosyltransferase
MIPSVTALIPSKNRPDRVQRLVDSIRRQNFTEPVEIIVVDDGSVPPLAFADTDIRLIRNETSQGACAARNRGFAAAAGEFIIMFDDDTELNDPTTFSRAVAMARAHQDFGAIGFRHLDPQGVPDPYQPANSDKACETSCFFGYGVLLRREAIRQTGGFVENFGYGYEEQDLSLQLHDAGWRIMYVPQLSLLHHHDPRGRNWVRIHRLIARNAIRSILLRFPLAVIAPWAAARWMLFFFASPRQIGRIDWAGGAEMLWDTLKYVPYAATHRQPVRIKTIRRYRQLRNAPEAIDTAVRHDPTASPAALATTDNLEIECTLSASS